MRSSRSDIGELELGDEDLSDLTPFFVHRQAQFFRPLTWRTREKFSFALKAIYGRLHGPDTVLNRRLDRPALTALLERVLTTSPAEILPANGDDPTDAGEIDAARIIRELEEHGWLETYTDPASVTRVWRLTTAGKRFARTLWESQRRPVRTRHRNMRSCDAALAAYAERGDADDLIDAEGYAEQVLDDLSEDIEDMRERLREVTRALRLHGATVEAFQTFVTEGFRKEHAPRLTADSAVRLKSSITTSLESLRRLPQSRLEEYEQQLRERVVGQPQIYGYHVLAAAERIERLVRNAVELKIPELINGYETYIQRMVGIIRQTSVIDAAGGDPVRILAQDLKPLADDERRAVLDEFAAQLAPSRLRLYAPFAFSFKRLADEVAIEPVSVEATPDPQSVLEAEIQKQFEQHLLVNEEDALVYVFEAARARGGRVRLSELPIATARDLLRVLGARSALELTPGVAIEARPLPVDAATAYFTTPELEFVLHDSLLHDNPPARASG